MRMKKTINAVLKFDLFDAKHFLVVSQDPIREREGTINTANVLINASSCVHSSALISEC